MSGKEGGTPDYLDPLGYSFCFFWFVFFVFAFKKKENEQGVLFWD